MKKLIALSIVCILMAFAIPKTTKSEDAKPKIQVALMLDTSGSMSGLIDQAKSQLWKIVNELATSKQNGQIPDIEIALYEYGKSSLRVEEGYVKQIANLTTDLDKISEELFALRTNGGDEYCGWVIQDGTDKLAWDHSADVLKIIFIAGNEPFTQGPKDYRNSCKQAITKGIIVNTIFCGDYQEGIATKWQDGAFLAEGKYFNIETNAVSQHIPTPFDTTIMRLNSSLNKTYIGYNHQGAGNIARQSKQDSNAAAMSPSVARERASFKAKKQYNNASWDLVDAYAADKAVVEEVEEEALPEAFRNLNKEELAQKIKEMTTERKTILEQIRQAEKQARSYEEEYRKSNPAEGNTLDKAMMKAIHIQAKAKNFKF